MRRALLLAVLINAAPAFAALPGLDAYKRGEYQSAATSLKAVLLTGQLSKSDATSARMYLAASYFALGDAANAKATLKELVESNPDATFEQNIFDPDLVAQHEELRKAELQRREALAKTDEKKVEAKVDDEKVEEPSKPQVVEKPRQPAPTTPFELRVGVFSLTDIAGKPRGTAALTLSAVFSGVEVGVRAFPGSQTVNGETKLTFGAGAEAGYLFLDGPFTPRLGARVTIYPGLPSGTGTGVGLGGGLVAGVRYRVIDRLCLAADASGELNQMPDSARYRSFSAVLSAGAQLIF